MSDNFVSTPTKDAKVLDLTEETLVLDVENSLGENFHFEIEPGDGDVKVTRKNAQAPTGKRTQREDELTLMYIQIPFLF